MSDKGVGQSVHREEFTADQRNQLPEGQRGEVGQRKQDV